MSLNTSSLSRREYFLSLSRKIHLTPDDSVLEDCSSYLDSLEGDISALESLDLSTNPIHRGPEELSIPFNSIGSAEFEEENRGLLDSIVDNYEFTNIRSEDKEQQ